MVAITSSVTVSGVSNGFKSVKRMESYKRFLQQNYMYMKLHEVQRESGEEREGEGEGGGKREGKRGRESELLPLVVMSMASMRPVPLTAVVLLSSPPADRPAPSLAEPSDLWMSAMPTPATPTAMLSMVCIIMSHTYNS